MGIIHGGDGSRGVVALGRRLRGACQVVCKSASLVRKGSRFFHLSSTSDYCIHKIFVVGWRRFWDVGFVRAPTLEDDLVWCGVVSFVMVMFSALEWIDVVRCSCVVLILCDVCASLFFFLLFFFYFFREHFQAGCKGFASCYWRSSLSFSVWWHTTAGAVLLKLELLDIT